jgi:hypothetical protein
VTPPAKRILCLIVLLGFNRSVGFDSTTVLGVVVTAFESWPETLGVLSDKKCVMKTKQKTYFKEYSKVI